MESIRSASVLVAALGIACGSPSMFATGTGSSETGGANELETLCAEGCVRFEQCSALAFAATYEDQDQCAVECVVSFSSPLECREAAVDYARCSRDLSCDDLLDALADPTTSECANEWSVVQPACLL